MNGVIRQLVCGVRRPDVLKQNPDDSFSQMAEKCRMNGNNTEGNPPAEPEECAAKTAEICWRSSEVEDGGMQTCRISGNEPRTEIEDLNHHE